MVVEVEVWTREPDAVARIIKSDKYGAMVHEYVFPPLIVLKQTEQCQLVQRPRQSLDLVLLKLLPDARTCTLPCSVACRSPADDDARMTASDSSSEVRSSKP